MNIKHYPVSERHVVRQAIEWVGASGACYQYYIWPRGAHIEGVHPGNFLHVRETEEGTLEPVFIGQTDDLNHRLLTPEETAHIDLSGATQLHLHISYKGVQQRLHEQADLVERWRPSCNDGIQAARQKSMAMEEAQRLGV